jgi:hypothetical protein
MIIFEVVVISVVLFILFNNIEKKEMIQLYINTFFFLGGGIER